MPPDRERAELMAATSAPPLLWWHRSWSLSELFLPAKLDSPRKTGKNHPQARPTVHPPSWDVSGESRCDMVTETVMEAVRLPRVPAWDDLFLTSSLIHRRQSDAFAPFESQASGDRCNLSEGSTMAGRPRPLGRGRKAIAASPRPARFSAAAQKRTARISLRNPCEPFAAASLEGGRVLAALLRREGPSSEATSARGSAFLLYFLGISKTASRSAANRASRLAAQRALPIIR